MLTYSEYEVLMNSAVLAAIVLPSLLVSALISLIVMAEVPVLSRLWCKLVRTVLRDETSLVEIGLALSDFVWAYSLLVAVPHLFAVSPSYVAIEQTGVTQPIFGWAFLVIGLLKVVGFVFEQPGITALAALPAVVVWSMASIGFANAPSPQPTGVGIYAVAAIGSAIVGLRASTAFAAQLHRVHAARLHTQASAGETGEAGKAGRVRAHGRDL